MSIIAAFWAVSFLFVITPGLDWAYAISAGTRGKVVLPAVSGLLLGHLTATVVVAAGIGAIVASHPIALTGIVIIGSVYLLWMGVNLVIKPASPCTCDEKYSGTGLNWLTKGIFVSGLNPKVFLLFLALLPQFTDPTARWSISTQIVILGLIHIFSSGVVYLMVGYGSQAVLQSRPRAAEVVSKSSGVLMIVIALLLLHEQMF
jgi:threonine/homoserine/homoserine lactone efflux protein